MILCEYYNKQSFIVEVIELKKESNLSFIQKKRLMIWIGEIKIFEKKFDQDDVAWS